MPSKAVSGAIKDSGSGDSYNDAMYNFASTGSTSSGGGFMPPAVAAAGIGAGASLLGGIMGNRAASKASKMEAASNAAALEYQKQKDAQDRADAKAQWDAHQAQLQPYLRARASIFKRYGIPIDSGPAPMPTGGMPAGGPSGPGGPPVMARPVMAQQSPVMVPGAERGPLPGPQDMPPGMPRGLTLGDLPNWSAAAWGGR